MPTYEITHKPTGRVFDVTGPQAPTPAQVKKLFANLPAENLIGEQGNPAAVRAALEENRAIDPSPVTGSPFMATLQALIDPDGKASGDFLNTFLMNFGGNAGDSQRGVEQRMAEEGMSSNAFGIGPNPNSQLAQDLKGMLPEDVVKEIEQTEGKGSAEEIQARVASDAQTQAITNEAMRQNPAAGISGMATSLIVADPINYVGLGMIDKAIRAPHLTSKLAKGAQIMAAGGATGFVSGQTTYLDKEIPLTRNEMTAITTGAGALLSGVAGAGVGWYGARKKAKDIKELGNRLTNYENTFNLELIRTGGDRSKALKAAKQATGLTQNKLKYAADMTDSTPPRLGKNILEAAEALENNSHIRSILPSDLLDTLASKDVDAIKLWGSGIDPLFGGTTSTKQAARVGRLAGKGGEDGWFDSADFYLGAMKTRLKNYSPDIADELTRMDFKVSTNSHKWTEAGVKFFDDVDKFEKMVSKKQFDTFVGLMYTDRNAAMKYLEGFTGTKSIINSFKTVAKTLDDIADSGASIDGFVGRLEGHFPRRPSGDKSKHSLIYADEDLGETLTKQFKNVKGDAEKTSSLVNKVVKTPETSKGSGSSLGHRRLVREVRDWQTPAYASLRASYDSYVNDAARVIGRKQFFDGVGDGVDPFVKLTGEQLDTSALQRAIAKQNLEPEDARKVATILQARFGQGEMGIGPRAALLKDISHIVLLGDVKSAMTQLGDLYANMHKNGVWNAFIGTAKALRMGSLSKETVFGLNNMVIDMAGTRPFHKVADGVLRLSGFRKVDNFGKTAQMEAALNKWRKLAVSDADRALKGKKAGRTGVTNYLGESFDERWSGLFNTPESLQALKDDLNNLNKFMREGIVVGPGPKRGARGAMKDRPITDNIGLMLWDELSSVQPIAISDMPEAWARSKHRLGYTLQSFTLKQLDIMRNDIYNNLTAATTKTPEGRLAMARAAKSFVTYSMFFTGTQAGVDKMKEHFTSGITGKPVKEWGDTLENAALKGIGLNKYGSDKFFESGDVWSLIAAFGGAAVAPFSVLTQALLQDKPEKVLELLPVVGRTAKDIVTERKAADVNNISGMSDEDKSTLDTLFPDDDINKLF